MKPLTIGSLFSGIGGLDLGIERGLASAGVAAETIWQVEQSDYWPPHPEPSLAPR